MTPRQLAETILTSMPCTCGEEWKSRKLADPDCHYHSWSDCIVDEIESSLASQADEIERLNRLVAHCCERFECTEEQLSIVVTANWGSLKILKKMYDDVLVAVWGDVSPKRMHSETMDKLRAALKASQLTSPEGVA